MINFLLLLYSVLLLFDQVHAASTKTQQIVSRNSTGYLYGAGVMVSESAYIGTKTRTLPLPLVGYKGEKLTVFGPFVSYDFAHEGPITLFVQLAPRFQSFDESDSFIFTGMAERKNTVEAGFGYKLKINQWLLRGATLSELLGESDSTDITTSLTRGFRYGPIVLTPSISASYLSNDHVNYYYGVKAAESNGSRPIYQGLKTINYSLGFTVATPIFFSGMSRLTLTNTWLGSEIKNSPLVDESNILSLQYTFTKLF